MKRGLAAFGVSVAVGTLVYKGICDRLTRQNAVVDQAVLRALAEGGLQQIAEGPLLVEAVSGSINRFRGAADLQLTLRDASGQRRQLKVLGRLAKSLWSTSVTEATIN